MSAGRLIRLFVLASPTIALLVVGGWYAAGHLHPSPSGADDPVPDAPSSPNGRLVVVLVFDQMRGDYLSRWSEVFAADGFERLKRDGVWYPEAHLPYACSATAPGHASIGTGVPPSAHGIVENRWYDRRRGKMVYCASADRPYDWVPGGQPALTEDGGGLAPARLLVSGLGDHLRQVTNRKGRCFSLALKDRAAVLMGGKEPAGCYCFDPATGEFHTSSYYREAAPAWVETFNRSGFADRWLGVDWSRLLDPAVYNRLAGPDDVAAEASGAYRMGRTLPKTIGPGLGRGDPRYYQALESSPFGNELLWEFARACINQERLGRGDGPDLLFVGFSANDLIGHAWGPDSHEVLDATARSDRLTAEVLKFLDEKVGPGRYTVIVTADHGICPLPEVAAKQHPGAARFDVSEFGPLSDALAEAFGPPDPTAGPWVEKVDYPWIYLNRKAAAGRGVPTAELERFTAQWVGNRPSGQAGYTRTELAGPPSADPLVRSVQLAFHPERSGDVYCLSRPYLLPTGVGSVGTEHRTPWPYDTHVPILAIGGGIPKLGPRPGRVSSLTVAPIVCRALSIDPPVGLPEKVPFE